MGFIDRLLDRIAPVQQPPDLSTLDYLDRSDELCSVLYPVPCPERYVVVVHGFRLCQGHRNSRSN